jgi:two-component system cell cycle response regulator
VEQDDREVIALRRRIAALLEDARANEAAWQRAQRRELELLEAPTLGVLLERLTDGLRLSYRAAAVTLVLVDPEHEIRHLLLGSGCPLSQYAGVRFVDAVRAPRQGLGTDRRPWLGKFDPAAHGKLFPGAQRLRSVALLPLTRGGRVIGRLNLGSHEPRRFTSQLATDFLSHLGVIAAFCLENAVNHARLVRSGLTDALTGWHNRRYLQTRLEEELARCRRERKPLTCLMIDVDHFKRVNDVHGHAVGDEVLRQVAQCILGEVRDSDVSARYGGEEFIVLLPGTTVDAGRSLAERIRRAVSIAAFVVDGVVDPLSITVSIGVAEHRERPDGEDVERAGDRLIALADQALYEAKAGGRNAVAHAANS